ncbi:respiratory nitrate reductase subunit gamma [Streptomyces sp. NPDC088812]
MTFFLRGVLPCVAFVLLVAGLVWRHRHDRFGWTSARRCSTCSGRG